MTYNVFGGTLNFAQSINHCQPHDYDEPRVNVPQKLIRCQLRLTYEVKAGVI